jgi:predicted transposase YdaD
MAKKEEKEDIDDVKTGGEDDKARFSHDSFWKDLMAEYFYPLLRRALPELYGDADIRKKPRFLDKEFTDILKTADPKAHRSPHFADFVLEVPLKDGSRKWVLCHFEAQSSRGGGDLAERMNFYRCLIYAHYRREPAAVAIIAQKRPGSEPASYSRSLYGTRVSYEYNNLALHELDDDELISSDNPIDLVLYAAKRAAGKRKEIQKYNYMKTAIGLLAERGWDMDDKRRLMLYIERITNLNDEELMARFAEYQEQLDREGKIVYVSIAERHYTKKGMEKGIEKGIAKGIEKGIEKGKLEVARNLLARGISPDIIAESAGLPKEKILELMSLANRQPRL